MILAAGYGTRLRPLTDEKPKALVDVGQKKLLEWIILKLKNSGIHSIVINLHHLGDRIKAYLQAQNYFNISIEFSEELKILGTGGGIAHASSFFQNEPDFLVHNVDVLSTLNLHKLINYHRQQKNLGTLFVQNRITGRPLIFDAAHLLCGRYSANEALVRLPAGKSERFAFNGIHVLSSRIFDFMPAPDFFSIIDVYLQCVAGGERIGGYADPGTYWRDVGRLETLQQIEYDLHEQHNLSSQLIR